MCSCVYYVIFFHISICSVLFFLSTSKKVIFIFNDDNNNNNNIDNGNDGDFYIFLVACLFFHKIQLTTVNCFFFCWISFIYEYWRRRRWWLWKSIFFWHHFYFDCFNPFFIAIIFLFTTMCVCTQNFSDLIFRSSQSSFYCLC